MWQWCHWSRTYWYSFLNRIFYKTIWNQTADSEHYVSKISKFLELIMNFYLLTCHISTGNCAWQRISPYWPQLDVTFWNEILWSRNTKKITDPAKTLTDPSAWGYGGIVPVSDSSRPHEMREDSETRNYRLITGRILVPTLLTVRRTNDQCCGSTLMRARIQHFRSILIQVLFRLRILGFDDQNCKYYTAEKYLPFLIKKIASYFSLGLHVGRSSYRRSLQPSKANKWHFQTLKFLTFFVFLWVFFTLLVLDQAAQHQCGSGSTTLPKIE